MRGSGRIVSRQYDLSGFTAIRASRFEVEVIQSERYGVAVRVDDNLLDVLDVRKSGDTLILRLTPTLSHFRHVTLEATVTMPSLTGVGLSGSASAHLRDFGGIGRLDAELSGASELNGRVAAENIVIAASGASRVRLAGKTRGMVIDVSGASRLDLAELAAGTGTIDVSGASRATVNIAEKIDWIEASGASRVRYLNDPRLDHVETSGASRVVRV
jgi:hypothetical protein